MIPVFKDRKLTMTELGLYVAVLAKHARLVVLVLCLCLTAGLVFFVFSTPVYYSKSVIYVHSRQSGAADSQSVFGDTTGRALMEQIQAPHIMERSAEALGAKVRYMTILRDYLKKYRVYQDLENNIVVEVWSYRSDWTRLWTKTCLDTYLRYREDSRKAYVEGLLRNYADDMARVKAKMEEYSREGKLLEEDPRLLQAWKEVQEVGDVPAQLTQAQARLQVLRRIREQLHDSTLDTLAKLALASRVTSEIQVGQLIPGKAGLGEPSGSAVRGASGVQTVVVPAMISSGPLPWEAMDQRKREIEARMRELNRKFLPGHPKVMAVQRELEKVQGELDAELAVVMNRFELEYRLMENTVSKLQADLPVYKERRDRFERLTRDASEAKAGWVTGLEKMYANMAKHLEEVNFGIDRERTQFEYGGFIQLNEKPVSPNRFKLMMVFLAIGLALGVSVPFLIEYLDHTISMLDQAESDLGLRGLGVIPLIRETTGEHGTGPGLLISADENRILRETFRVIRTNILAKKDLSAAQKVLLVTSTLPREGKSMIAANTAIAFAQLGDRTLLIDADVHRGRQHRVFGIDTRPGIAGVLIDHVPVVDAIKTSQVAGLDILSVGRYSRELPELVSSSAFGQMIQVVKGRYDRVVVDCPPVLGLAETSSLIPLSDGVIMVIWSGHTPLNQVKAAATLLAANGAKFLGCILNRLDLTSATNYYYYYYHSDSYYYNYHPELPPKPEAEAEA